MCTIKRLNCGFMLSRVIYCTQRWFQAVSLRLSFKVTNINLTFSVYYHYLRFHQLNENFTEHYLCLEIELNILFWKLNRCGNSSCVWVTVWCFIFCVFCLKNTTNQPQPCSPEISLKWLPKCAWVSIVLLSVYWNSPCIFLCFSNSVILWLVLASLWQTNVMVGF